MMEVGFSEILLISVLALIVLGPEKLPKVAADIGRWVGRARAMARQFREQLEDEAALAPTRATAHANTKAAGTAATASAAAAAASSPDAGLTPEDYAANNEPIAAHPGGSLDGEIPLDHAESTPHAPLEDYTESTAPPADDATNSPQPHEERLPRP